MSKGHLLWSAFCIRLGQPVSRGTQRLLRRTLWPSCLVLLFLPLATRAHDPAPPGPLRVLIVGGGPNLEYNQVAIESNVRYLGRLLPNTATRTTLFADGDPNHATVLYEEDPSTVPAGERVVNLLLRGHFGGDDNPSHYRKPNVGGRLDGPSKRQDISRAFAQLRQEESASPHPLLLYFTGHGSPDEANYQNNYYDLWGEKEELSVRELAQQIARLPADVPVTIVMVQCFSGAFGNLIFDGGNPNGSAVSRDIAGFFGTDNQHVAAGCTSAVNEAEYHDFTSYFFAALTGRDRVGRRVSGADYNGDGRVGMDEAFCYTLIHDESIDVPVCTSDVFLRRYVPMKDPEVFRTPYSSVREWATPAQAAALDALSSTLHLTGDDRLGVAYRKMRMGNSNWSRHDTDPQMEQQFNALREEGRRILFRRWPDLRLSDANAARAARQEAVGELTREVRAGKWQSLLNADDAMNRNEMEREAEAIAESHVLRFVRLGKSVVLAHWLRENGSDAVKARYLKLIEAEARTLLPPADIALRQ